MKDKIIIPQLRRSIVKFYARNLLSSIVAFVAISLGLVFFRNASLWIASIVTVVSWLLLWIGPACRFYLISCWTIALSVEISDDTIIVQGLRFGKRFEHSFSKADTYIGEGHNRIIISSVGGKWSIDSYGFEKTTYWSTIELTMLREALSEHGWIIQQMPI